MSCGWLLVEMESRLKRVRGYGGSSTYSQLNEDEDEQENLLGHDTLLLGNLHPKKRGDWSPVQAGGPGHWS